MASNPKGPIGGCVLYADGGRNYNLEMDFNCAFEVTSLKIHFKGLLYSDLEQLELDLQRHLCTVRKLIQTEDILKKGGGA